MEDSPARKKRRGVNGGIHPVPLVPEQGELPRFSEAERIARLNASPSPPGSKRRWPSAGETVERGTIREEKQERGGGYGQDAVQHEPAGEDAEAEAVPESPAVEAGGTEDSGITAVDEADAEAEADADTESMASEAAAAAAETTEPEVYAGVTSVILARPDPPGLSAERHGYADQIREMKMALDDNLAGAGDRLPSGRDRSSDDAMDEKNQHRNGQMARGRGPRRPAAAAAAAAAEVDPNADGRGVEHNRAFENVEIEMPVPLLKDGGDNFSAEILKKDEERCAKFGMPGWCPMCSYLNERQRASFEALVIHYARMGAAQWAIMIQKKWYTEYHKLHMKVLQDHQKAGLSGTVTYEVKYWRLVDILEHFREHHSLPIVRSIDRLRRLRMITKRLEDGGLSTRSGVAPAGGGNFVEHRKEPPRIDKTVLTMYLSVFKAVDKEEERLEFHTRAEKSAF